VPLKQSGIIVLVVRWDAEEEVIEEWMTHPSS